HPALHEDVTLGIEELDAWPLALEDRAHLAHELGAPLVVRTVAHLEEEAVVVGAREVRGVRAALAPRHLAPEEEEEVLGIGIVGDPAPQEDLVGAATHLVLELVVARGRDLDVEAELPPAVAEELVAQPAARARVRGVEREVQ